MFNRSINESVKKLKYLKKPKSPILINILIYKYNFFVFDFLAGTNFITYKKIYNCRKAYKWQKSPVPPSIKYIAASQKEEIWKI